jgi:transglutaminase-like putative cysteine protease
MRLKKYFILCLLIFSIQLISASSSFSYSSMSINWTLVNSLDSTANELTATVNSYPSDDFIIGQLAETTTSSLPNAQVSNADNLSFEWKGSDSKGVLILSINSLVQRNFAIQQITSEIKYDDLILSIPEDIKKYALPSAFSDSDNQYIKIKANEILKESGNDALEIVYNVASYVSENTEYDSAYINELKPASWVLQNKRGACDEYTNLFIALCRALGIPARYVSGIAYSNEDNAFSPHAWAEVYVGGKWIPYDTTFNQFGWIDVTHISYKKYVDGRDASLAISYSYLGGQILKNEDIVNAAEISHGSNLKPLTEISAKVLENKSGFNSYIPLEVTVKNLQPYYLSVPVVLSSAPGVYGKNVKTVFLRPFGEEKIYFILNIPEMEQCVFGCNAIISLNTIFGDNFTTKLEISKKYPSFSLEQATFMITEPSSKSKTMLCLPDKQEYYSYENITINCSINSDEKLQVCLRDNCAIADSRTNQVSFSINAENETGVFDIVAKKNNEVAAYSSISVKISSIPVLIIKKIEPVNNTVYGDGTYINLTAEASQQINTNISIGKIGPISAKFQKGMNKAQIPFSTLKLKAGINRLEVKITFSDNNGQQYSAKDFVDIYVQDVSFFERIWIWIKTFLGF